MMALSISMLGLRGRSLVPRLGAIVPQARNVAYKAVPFTTTPEEFKSSAKFTIHDEPTIRNPGDLIDLKTIEDNWVSFPGVGFNSVLQIPIYQFEVPDIEQVDDSRSLILPNDIFGAPIRKDLIHRAYWFHRRAMAGYTMRIQFNRYEWFGSHRKIRQQKGSGKARMSWRKAPGKYEGVKAHPLRPHDQRINVLRKNVWEAMRSMLSAKYLDGSLMVVNDFNLSSHKTKYAVKALRRLVGYRCNSALLVHDGIEDANDNFRFACANITAVRRETANTLSVYTLVKYRKVIITEKALETLMRNMQSYPATQGWLPRHATPDGTPAPVPERVRGWNLEYLQKKEAERRQAFDRETLKQRMRDWKWTNTRKGAFKVQRHDAFKGFRLLDPNLTQYVPKWATTEQIVYQDDAPVDFISSQDAGDADEIMHMRDALMQQEALLESVVALKNPRRALANSENLMQVQMMDGEEADMDDMDEGDMDGVPAGVAPRGLKLRASNSGSPAGGVVGSEEEEALRRLEEELDDLDFRAFANSSSRKL